MAGAMAARLEEFAMSRDTAYVRWFEDLGAGDVPEVGGKNASLGEMIRHLRPLGVRIPAGFATTAHAYRTFISAHGIDDEIRSRVSDLHEGRSTLQEVGSALRE